MQTKFHENLSIVLVRVEEHGHDTSSLFFLTKSKVGSNDQHCILLEAEFVACRIILQSAVKVRETAFRCFV